MNEQVIPKQIVYRFTQSLQTETKILPPVYTWIYKSYTSIHTGWSEVDKNTFQISNNWNVKVHCPRTDLDSTMVAKVSRRKCKRWDTLNWTRQENILGGNKPLPCGEFRTWVFLHLAVGVKYVTSSIYRAGKNTNFEMPEDAGPIICPRSPKLQTQFQNRQYNIYSLHLKWKCILLIKTHIIGSLYILNNVFHLQFMI